MLKNLSIKSLLIFISISVTLASIIFVIMLWLGFDNIETSEKQLLKQESVVIELKNTRFHIVQIQQFLTDVGATHNQGGFTEAKQNLNEAVSSLSRITSIRPDLDGFSNQLRQQIQDMHQAGEKMAWDYVNHGIEAGNVGMQELDTTATRLTETLDRLSNQLDEELSQSIQEMHKSMDTSRNTRILFAVMLMLFVVASLLAIYLKVEPPLSALKKTLSSMNQGGGDLSRRIPHESDDEIGEIVTGFNDFLNIIQNMMRQVAMETEKLVSTSQRLSQMADSAKEDVYQQQLSTDQVATTVTELSSTVQEVAQNTGNASQTAQDSDRQAQNGKAVVADTIQSIHLLSQGIDEASTVISAVENDCNNVSSVLDVIQGIADQTNLLALNAAIEAARAGEQGRGFAVVADEVRSLASKTQDSTKEIQEMIERLQQGSRKAVDAMTESQQQSKATVSVIEETGQVLDKISAMATQISDMNNHISTAVNEQQIVVEHINQNIVTINNVAATSSQDSDNTVQEAHHLQTIADSLQKSIGQFNL